MSSITDVISDKKFMEKLKAVCYAREKNVLDLIDKAVAQISQAYETINEIEQISPFVTFDGCYSAPEYLEKALRLLKNGRDKYKSVYHKKLVTAAVDAYSRKLKEHNASSS